MATLAGLEPAAKRLEGTCSVPAFPSVQSRLLDGSILALAWRFVVWFADGRNVDPGRGWNRAAKQANLDQLAEECVRERGNVADDCRLAKPAILRTIGEVRSPCDVHAMAGRLCLSPHLTSRSFPLAAVVSEGTFHLSDRQCFAILDWAGEQPQDGLVLRA
ncbi:hypothetical protein [Streptomyces olivaceus]